MHYAANLGGNVHCYNCPSRTGLSPSDIAQINDIYSPKVAAREANAYKNGMPEGQYALPMTRHGCPDGFRDSMFLWDDENSQNQNSKSVDFFNYMVGYQLTDTFLYFCDSGNGNFASASAICVNELTRLSGGCHLITNRQTCMSGKDGRKGDHFDSPCVWCGYGPDDRCTTHNKNRCEPQSFLELVPDVLVTPEKHEYACSQESLQSKSCLNTLTRWTNGCHLITSRDKCLSGKDGRRGDHFDSPCVWCGDGKEDRCTTHNWNKCEPQSFLEGVPDVLVTPDKHERAIDSCSSGSSVWPAGQYCILRGAETKSCPTGFTHSSWYQDDEDDNGKNRNQNYGEVNVIESSDKYGGSTYHFCCRTDGDVNTEAVLVSNAVDGPESFALYPKAAICQKFKYYSSKMLTIFQDNENSGNYNRELRDEDSVGLPYGDFDRDTRLYICVYSQPGVTFTDDFSITPPKSDVIDAPDDFPAIANDEPGYEFRLYLNYKQAVISLVVVVVMSVMVLVSAFVCCRYAVNKCMKRQKHGKYAKVSMESDAWSASDADKEVNAGDC